MEAAQVALLQDLLRRESRSLLQYAHEAYPWSKAEGQAGCDAIRAMAQAEAEAVAKLGRWLAKQRVPVTFPGAYPMQFTTVNYIALHALLPRLIADQKRRSAAVEGVGAVLSDEEGRALVQALLDLKKDHAQQLAALQGMAAPAAAAS